MNVINISMEIGIRDVPPLFAANFASARCRNYLNRSEERERERCTRGNQVRVDLHAAI